MADPPKRKIVYIVNASGVMLGGLPYTRRGQSLTVVLECGHDDTATRTEMRRGRLYCFGCFYNKPPNPLYAEFVEKDRQNES